MLHRLKDYVVGRMAAGREYYRDGSEYIADLNLHALQRYSIVTVLLLTACLFFIHIKGGLFTATVALEIAFTVHAGLWIIVYAFRKNLEGHAKAIQTLCLIFLMSMLTILVYLSTFGMPKAPAIFYSPFVLVLLMVFTLPMWQVAICVILSDAAFAWLSSVLKTADIFLLDMHTALITFALSLIIMGSFFSSRINNFRLRRELMRRSCTDSLTGLMNKSTVETTARSYLLQYGNQQKSALMVIDIDQFKQINDLLGHQAGDEALEVFGETLTRLFRTQDIVGRIGGDEFLVVMKNMEDPEMIVRRADAICKAVRDTRLKHFDHALTCSIGIALCPKHGVTYHALFSQADKQLYQLKRDGKNGFRIVP